MHHLLLALGLGLTPLAVSAAEPMRIAIYGDSTAKGDGAQVQWYKQLGEHLGAEPEIHPAGVSRYGIDKIAMAMRNDAEHRGWTVIVYDRRNAGETVEEWMAALAAGLEGLATDRFLVMPQVPVSGGREDRLTMAVLLGINEALRATYPNNTFGAELEAELLTALAGDSTRSDHIHRNDLGQQIEAKLIGGWLASKGW